MAFDEEASLEATVGEIVQACASLDRPVDVLIVDDGSRDGTGAIADRLAGERPQVRVVHHPHNLGLGGVYRTGFAQARGAFVSFFPADGQFDPAVIGRFLEALENADIVLGHYAGRARGLIGRALTALERLLYLLLFGWFPRFRGVLMIRRALLECFPLESTGRGWVVLMELILRAHRGGCRLVSVSTGLRPRTRGASKVQDWRTVLSNLRQLIALRRVL